MFAFFLTANANEIDKYISQEGVDSHSILSMYVEDIDSGKVVYKKKEEKLHNPASTLKVLTFGSAYLTLGEDYEFKTIVYIDKQNNLYVKLGADPLLTSEDLKKLFSEFREKLKISKINNIYIDDSIIDKETCPSSWMKDDMWPNSKKLSPYIIDNNTVKISIVRSSLSTKVDIIQENDYKMPVINELVLLEKGVGEHKIKILKKYESPSKIITLSGTVNKDDKIYLPVYDSELYFKIKLKKALEANKIDVLGEISVQKILQDVKEVAYVSHNIKEVSKGILFNSDNFASEIVFKVAAAKYINYIYPAGIEDALVMFKDVFNAEISEEIKVADASGVSRYNLLTADFYIKAFKKLLNETNIEELLPRANEGSLYERTVFLKENLRAKTGTLSGVSSLSGILKTKKGNKLVFVINNQNSPKRNAILKNFEDNIITILYRRY